MVVYLYQNRFLTLLIKKRRINNMFCTNCGKQVPNGAQFCPHCGAAMNSNGANSQPYAQSQPNQNFNNFDNVFFISFLLTIISINPCSNKNSDV